LQIGPDVLSNAGTADLEAISEERERKVDLLADRISRIREEKERLERIQELKDLEEQTKRELLAAWKVDGDKPTRRS
jgi:hypothetical protein